MDKITVSVDAMGGDNAPVNEVAGAVETVREKNDINVILVGKQSRIEKELSKYSYDPERIKIHHRL